MKTFIISIVMLLVLISGIFFAQSVMIKKVDNQVATLYDLYEQIQKSDWKKAQETVEGFSKSLEKEEMFYAAMIEHIDYDNILTQSSMMREYVFHNAKSDSAAQASTVVTLLEHIKDKSQLSWQNIL